MNNLITKEQSTVLKGLAILSVILTHGNVFAQAFVGIPILQNSIITSILCHIGMCTFLILSGYGIYSSFSVKGFDGYWNKKILNIYIPAMIVQILFQAVQVVINYKTTGSMGINLESVFSDVLCISQNNNIDGAMWYLSYQFFCYLIFFIVFTIVRDEKCRIPVFVICWILLLLPMIILWMHGFYLVASFAIGVVYSYLVYNKHFTIDKKVKILFAIVAVCLSVGYYFVYMQNTLVDNMASNILAIALIFIVQLTGAAKIKALKFIGDYSFYIYLLQGKVIFGLFNYDNHSQGVRLMAFLVLLVLDIALAYVINKIYSVVMLSKKEVSKC